MTDDHDPKYRVAKCSGCGIVGALQLSWTRSTSHGNSQYVLDGNCVACGKWIRRFSLRNPRTKAMVRVAGMPWLEGQADVLHIRQFPTAPAAPPTKLTPPRSGALASDAIRETRRWLEREPLRIGLAVTAAIRNLHEQDSTGGMVSEKYRPAIVVARRDDETWGLVGLTTNPTYADGRPRVPVPHWRKFLKGPGYIWGPRLAFVPGEDIGKVLGPAPAEVLRYVLQHVTVTPDERVALLQMMHEERSAIGSM